MLDVHPPHHTPNTWRDFFLHIATIVIGLLIAIGLEQSVEAIHHHHQRHQLEDQMLSVLDANLALVSDDTRQITTFRGYLAELQVAVGGRRHGKTVPAPAPNDPRMKTLPRLPTLAPYEAAQQNGTVAVLPDNEIRLYNRVAFQRTLLIAQMQYWIRAIAALESFQQRFVDSKGSTEFGRIVTTPNLDDLSPEELSEYQKLIATLIKETDIILERLHIFDTQCHSILSGNRDENQLMKSLLDSNSSNPEPVTHP